MPGKSPWSIGPLDCACHHSCHPRRRLSCGARKFWPGLLVPQLRCIPSPRKLVRLWSRGRPICWAPMPIGPAATRRAFARGGKRGTILLSCTALTLWMASKRRSKQAASARGLPHLACRRGSAHTIQGRLFATLHHVCHGLVCQQHAPAAVAFVQDLPFLKLDTDRVHRDRHAE